ncbi:hypothetical protein NQ317_013652 [Molorchus minor]|uniref:Integrase catalytic domain-containing protein n=1 Tax=Molorchus minor TaxID=1323400 RepID=A0ABQ9JXB2_9CUCU|nr:hypothetical protein NQ317_013652 [Molorchus minor]
MTRSDVKLGIVRELHRTARRNFSRRRTIIKALHDLWQADLAEMQPYAHENKGMRYILVVIDCYSKYVWTRPLRNKTGIEVTSAMGDIIHKAGISPSNLQTDNGTEFYNKHFFALMKSWNINHYSTFSTKKAAIVERVIRTLKTWFYIEFSARGSYKWLDILPTITRKYNNKIHRTINMRPSEVTSTTLLEAYSHPKVALKPKYLVNDVVRISKYKGVFDKGFTANFSTELFRIVKVNITNPTTYLLEDMNGQQIKGCFYEHELQKTKYPDIYLVEKVLKKNKNKVYVKWLGFSKGHNSWIEETAIV